MEKSTLVDFDYPQLNLKINESSLDTVELTHLLLPSSLTAKRIEGNKIDLQWSKITNIDIKESIIEALFTELTADKIHLSETNYDISLSYSKVKRLKISDCNTDNTKSLSDFKVDELIFVNSVNSLYGITFVDSKINSFYADNSNFTNLNFEDAAIDKMAFIGGSIFNADFIDVITESISFRDVGLSGKIDFSGAATKEQNLKLIFDNSNIKF